MTSARASLRGFALMDALIAVLLVSIGVLGIAGLQVATVSDYRDTRMRQYATVLATDLADRIRANRAGIAAYTNSNLAAAADMPCASSVGSPCTPADLALDDLHHWKSSVTQLGFLATETSIIVDATVDPVTVEVELGWDSRAGAEGVTFKTEMR